MKLNETRGRKMKNMPTPPKHQGVGTPHDHFKCSKCAEVKHYLEFYCAPKSYTGYQSQCKLCVRNTSSIRKKRLLQEKRDQLIDAYLRTVG
jgi:hypothetical protein